MQVLHFNYQTTIYANVWFDKKKKFQIIIDYVCSVVILNAQSQIATNFINLKFYQLSI